MITSMTAFGRVQKETAAYSVLIEIRTLNSKYLDIVLRLPKNFMEFEDPFRKQIAGAMKRGRVEVQVQIEAKDIERKAPQLNLDLARFYWDQLLELHRRIPDIEPPRLEHLMGIPYLFESRDVPEDRESLLELLSETLSEALGQVVRMRLREGESLFDDCLDRLAHLREDVTLVESRREPVQQDFQRRLRDRMEELMGGLEVDESRLLQEVACFADRSDINEEIVRLKSHIDQMEKLLKGTKPADGRRLDFLTQELHREANTIGCKTGDLDTIQAVVRMKTEIGKLKEQVQNVE